MTKKKEVKEKTGAKFKLEVTPVFLDQVEKFADLGFTQKNMYEYHGVSKQTWFETCKRYPEIRNRIKIGRTKGLDFAVNKLREKMEAGCVTSLKFYLQCKHKWRPEGSLKLDAKIKTDKNSPIELKITTTDPVEAGKIYEQIMTTGS